MHTHTHTLCDSTQTQPGGSRRCRLRVVWMVKRVRVCMYVCGHLTIVRCLRAVPAALASRVGYPTARLIVHSASHHPHSPRRCRRTRWLRTGAAGWTRSPEAACKHTHTHTCVSTLNNSLSVNDSCTFACLSAGAMQLSVGSLYVCMYVCMCVCVCKVAPCD